MSIKKALYSGFLESCEKFPNRPALDVQNQVLSYRELKDQAASLALTLEINAPEEPHPLTALLANRSVTAHSGILAILFRGHGYVPLNPAFPVKRLRWILEHTECASLIIDSEGEKKIDELLEGIDRSLLLVFPEKNDVSELSRKWSQHRILGARDMESPDKWKGPEVVEQDSIAYILFTSGSTGHPKGVKVSHRNTLSLLSAMQKSWPVSELDIFSRFADIAFDFSVAEIFPAWSRGALVCCLSQKKLINPSKLISEKHISFLQMGPSHAVILKRLKGLKENAFPEIRWVVFGGEPLPMDIAVTFSHAAPNAKIVNAYGITEMTVHSTSYIWDNVRSPGECKNGIVPIGQVLPGNKFLIVNEDLQETDGEGEGELLLNGPQAALGYWKNEEKTKVSFIIPPKQNDVYYRTGDIVQKRTENDPLFFKCRIDHQVQLFGVRVELGEIEAILREITHLTNVVALGWPPIKAGAGGIVAFLETDKIDLPGIQSQLSDHLPHQIMPHDIRAISQMPLNVNGKIDRQALLAILNKTSEY
jgi:amino acid adenylation domain-containing protein